MRHGVILWTAAALAAASANAQTERGGRTELTIDEDGSWVEASAPEPGSDAATLSAARSMLAADDPGKAYRAVNDWIEGNKLTRSPLLAEAYLLRGDAQTARGNEYKALYDYETVINDFAADSAFVDAVERELEIGTRYLHGLRRKWLGLARIEDAKPLGTELLMRVQERLPGSRLAERAAIELADFFYREGELQLAAEMYDILLVNFPQTEHRVHAMERRIYSNIGQFKGPKYSAAGLVEARALIDDYQARFPVESTRSGIGEALAARVDHSAAAQMLTSARWYMKREDSVSARFTLKRLIRKHPSTAAAAEAVAILRERGWWEPELDSPQPQAGDIAPNEDPLSDFDAPDPVAAEADPAADGVPVDEPRPAPVASPGRMQPVGGGR